MRDCIAAYLYRFSILTEAVSQKKRTHGRMFPAYTYKDRHGDNAIIEILGYEKVNVAIIFAKLSDGIVAVDSQFNHTSPILLVPILVHGSSRWKYTKYFSIYCMELRKI